MISKAEYQDILEEQFAADLGAVDAAYREKLTLYIAHKDKDGNEVKDVERWVQAAEVTLSAVGGGATSLLVRGAWVGTNPTPLHEATTLVYTFAVPQQILDGVANIREFMHSYGAETGQGEVAASLENPDGSWFFRVPASAYDAD